MDNNRVGIILVVLFYLVASFMLLGNYKNWEVQYGKIIQAFRPVSESGFLILKNYPRAFIEATGTIGILLSFGAIFGSKLSVRLLTLLTLVFIFALNSTIDDIKIQDFQYSVLNIFSYIAITGGLIQGW